MQFISEALERQQSAMTNQQTVNRSRLGVVLWVAGAAGIISSLPFLSLLGASPGLNDWWLIRTGVLLTAAVSIGVVLAPRARLRAPVSEAAVSGRSIWKAVGSMIELIATRIAVQS